MFTDYRQVQHLKKCDELIEYYESVGMESFIDAIKKSGLTINPYDSKWRNKKLFQEIEEELVKINTVDLASWRQMLKESTLINDLYTKIFQLESYVLTKNIRPENECAAFIMLLEKYMFFISNIMDGKEKKNENINLQFTTGLGYENQLTDIEQYAQIFDHCSLVADDILKYLLFFKAKDIDKAYEATVEEQGWALEHIKTADVKSVVNTLTKEWQFFERKIDEKGGKVTSSCESFIFKDFQILKERLANRKFIIHNDISIMQDINKVLDLEEGINRDEKRAKLFLKEMLAVENLEYNGIVQKKDLTYVVKISKLVRAYAVLQNMVLNFMKFRTMDSNNLGNICLLTTKEYILECFTENGISLESVQDIFTILTLENYKDFYDTPIIPYNDKYLLIPSIVAHIDISQAILSCVNQFNFRGDAFEKKIIQILKNRGIICEKKLYKDESGEYQCDVLFLLDRELFICECKAWSEPRTIIGF